MSQESRIALRSIRATQFYPLMVRRRVSAVSNHAGRGPSFETPLRGSSSNNGEAVMQG